MDRIKEAESNTDSFAYQNHDAIFVTLRVGVIHSPNGIMELLYYLNRQLIYKHRMFHEDPNSHVALHDKGTWHMTPQSREHYYSDATTIFRSQETNAIFHPIEHAGTIDWLSHTQRQYRDWRMGDTHHSHVAQ